MAAPSYVPLDPTHHPRDYESAPWRDDPWFTERPGDFAAEPVHPAADEGRMGAPGPDQGYALKLIRYLRDELIVSGAEDVRDAEAAVVGIGLKRAALLGRAPILADLRVAAVVWGLLDAQAPSELVSERTRRFEGIRDQNHHYPELRAVVDAVPSETLMRTPEAVTADHRADWRALLEL